MTPDSTTSIFRDATIKLMPQPDASGPHPEPHLPKLPDRVVAPVHYFSVIKKIRGCKQILLTGNEFDIFARA